jgi:hypothetical protein
MNKSAAGYYQLYAMTIRRSLGQRRELRHYADRKRVAGGKAIDAAIQQVSDGVDAPRRHQCAKVEVLNTT